MEMTFDIDPALMRRARDEAARRGISVSDLMAAGLARMLEAEAAEMDAALPSLPTWHGGGPPLVDVADREALEVAMAKDENDKEPSPLPTWRGGEFLVDIANRDALDPAMVEDNKDAPLPPLPTWKSGGFVVDVADRKALETKMAAKGNHKKPVS